MNSLKKDKIRQAVRKAYGEIAKADNAGCCWHPSAPCCGTEKAPTAEETSADVGYSSEELSSVPEGTNMGLGCGNPQAIAGLKAGETVVDLGSGGGFDCFLAAHAVGEKGHIIGVDMTPEMISKARENAEKGGYDNVEFRLGEIENLPVADNSADIIISNCVINLSTDKQKVYKEAFRVLKGGGRLAIMDIVVTAELPQEVHDNLALYTGCVAGAMQIDDLKVILGKVGFKDIRIKTVGESKTLIRKWVPGSKLEDYILSASIEGVK